MRKKEESNLLSILVELLLMAVFVLLISMAFLDTKLSRIKESQSDLYRRLDIIEHNAIIADSAVIDLYQKTNELWYDSKGVPGKAH